jgi:hypothetical protein
MGSDGLSHADSLEKRLDATRFSLIFLRSIAERLICLTESFSPAAGNQTEKRDRCDRLLWKDRAGFFFLGCEAMTPAKRSPF